jgi:excisionase family DNA binding protein
MNDMVPALHLVQARVTQWPTNLLTAEEAAESTGLPVERIRDLAMSGYAPSWRIDGGEPLFKISELKAWLAENLVARTAGKALPTQVVVTHTGPPISTLSDVPLEIRSIVNLRDISDYRLTAGVYFLCIDKKVVYIGQSTVVGSRLAVHHKEGKKEFDRIYFMPWPEHDLARMEGALIRALRPSLNGGDARGDTRRMGAAIVDDIHRVLAETGFDERFIQGVAIHDESELIGARAKRLQNQAAFADAEAILENAAAEAARARSARVAAESAADTAENQRIKTRAETAQLKKAARLEKHAAGIAKRRESEAAAVMRLTFHWPKGGGFSSASEYVRYKREIKAWLKAIYPTGNMSVIAGDGCRAGVRRSSTVDWHGAECESITFELPTSYRSDVARRWPDGQRSIDIITWSDSIGLAHSERFDVELKGNPPWHEAVAQVNGEKLVADLTRPVI